MNADETRGYGKGYAAGRRKAKDEQFRENQRRERQAFWDKAFLSALTTCIAVDGWQSAGKPITNVAQRTSLAVSFADESVKHRRLIP